MPETTPLIKAALNLRVGVGFDVYGKCQLMQGIFQKENTDKALKYGIYRHLPTYEKIIRNLVSFYIKQTKHFWHNNPSLLNNCITRKRI